MFAKNAIFAQACRICPSVLYFPEVGQIQNMEIITFDLAHAKYNKSLYKSVQVLIIVLKYKYKYSN